MSGVGPNTALGMLSAMQPGDLRLAILGENVRAVQAIKGIGAKTAQRIILELRDKMKRSGVVPNGPTYRQQPAGNPVRDESLAALVALGFPKATAEKSVSDALQAEPNLTVEEVIRRALR